jgi:gluconolactonase
MSWVWVGVAASAALAVVGIAESAEALWVARPFTAEGSFTPGIEGPATDRDGNVYAVNYQRQSTIGKTRPDGTSEVYVELPNGSVGNGIRIDRQGFMYIADYTNHNVLRVDPKSKAVTVFVHEERMSQPNDLAIARDGTLYASDPNWKARTGQLWRIDRDGKVTRLAENMGTTNGIEVSPDGKTLYVNESGTSGRSRSPRTGR